MNGNIASQAAQNVIAQMGLTEKGYLSDLMFRRPEVEEKPEAYKAAESIMDRMELIEKPEPVKAAEKVAENIGIGKPSGVWWEYPIHIKGKEHPQPIREELERKEEIKDWLAQKEEEKRLTPKGIRALTPEEKEYQERYGLAYEMATRPEPPKEVAGWSKDPKVNYYSEKLAPHLRWWLVGAAAPGFVAAYEAIAQVPNVILSLKEKRAYDPLADRRITELLSKDTPSWLRYLAIGGEEATRLIASSIAAKKLSVATYRKSIDKLIGKMEKAGWPKEALTEARARLSRGRPEDLGTEIERLSRVSKAGVPKGPGRRLIEPETIPEERLIPDIEIRVSKDVKTGEHVIRIPRGKELPEVPPTRREAQILAKEMPTVTKNIAETGEKIEIPEIVSFGVPKNIESMEAEILRMRGIRKLDKTEPEFEEQQSAYEGRRWLLRKDGTPEEDVATQLGFDSIDGLRDHFRGERKVKTHEEIEEERLAAELPPEREAPRFEVRERKIGITEEPTAREIEEFITGVTIPRDVAEYADEIKSNLSDHLIRNYKPELGVLENFGRKSLKGFIKNKRKQLAKERVRMGPLPKEEISPGPARRPEEILEEKVEVKGIRKILKDASRDAIDIDIAEGRYLKNETFKELGDRHGMTKQAAELRWNRMWKEILKHPDFQKIAIDKGKGSKLDSVLEEIGEEISKVQREKYAKPGLAIERVKAPPEKERFRFSDRKTEERFEAARGIKPKSVEEIVKGSLGAIKRASRTYEYLPAGAEWAEARMALSNLAKQKATSWDKAIRILRGITIKSDKYKHDIFRRKVILDDLEQEAKLEHDLPFGFTKESLKDEKSRLDIEFNKHPETIDALEKRDRVWEAIKEDYIHWQEKTGHHIEDRLKKPGYFRHQVLKYAELKGLAGTGRKLKTPSYRGFLKGRTGSEFDINTNYLEAESEVMAQMLHDIEVAKTIDKLGREYDISDKVKKDAKEQGLQDWHKAIPEGYVSWQPRQGNVFYSANTLPEKLATEIMEGSLEDMGLVKEKIRKAGAIGRKRKEWIIKEDLAKQLDKLIQPPAPPWFRKLVKSPVRVWKVWVLTGPRRYFRYNIRNLTGDAEHVFVGNPSAFKKSIKAGAEIYKYFFGTEIPSKDVQGWIDRGGVHTTLPAQEISKLKVFKELHEGKKSVSDLPKKTWKGYWRAVRLSTDSRESILRLATYLDYLEQMEKSLDGKPKNFGASLPDEIMALKSKEDRAFRLSNELLGAYDEISGIGKALREYVIPFWSWKELNFKIYYRLFKNAARDNRISHTIGRKLLVGVAKTPFLALKVGRFAIMASAFWVLAELWNHLVFPDEDKKLPKDIRDRPHLTLGSDKDGNVKYFSRIGALGDFLEWFGLDAAPGFVSDYLDGRKTIKEIATEMAQSPVNQIVQGISPMIKGPMEVATRQALFPDVFNPRMIRDRGYHLARELALENEYKELAGKPSKPYKESLPKFFIYKVDPLEVAYYEIYDLKSDYLKEVGKRGQGFWLTPRGNALYNLKLSHRYGDEKAKKRYLEEYMAYHLKEHELTGKPIKEVNESIISGLKTSLRSMHPLNGLNKSERLKFIKSLSEDDKELLLMAMRFYNEVMLGRTEIK